MDILCGCETMKLRHHNLGGSGRAAMTDRGMNAEQKRCNTNRQGLINFHFPLIYEKIAKYMMTKEEKFCYNKKNVGRHYLHGGG